MFKRIKIATIAIVQWCFSSAMVLAAEVQTLTNPLAKSGKDLPTLIGTIIKNLMGILGSVALLMFLYGGFLWLTAAGDSNKVSKGKDTLIWAALGLALIFASYSFVNFVFTALGTK